MIGATVPNAIANALVPLTEAQSGLWYAQQLDPNNPLFNTGQYIEITGALDIAAFQRAVDTTVAEADALALRIVQTEDGPHQSVLEANRPWLQIIDLTHEPDPRAIAVNAIELDIGTPIYPAEAPLAAEKLYVLGTQHTIWYQRIHHLAIDGYGVSLLNKRIVELYESHAGLRSAGNPLASLSAAFDDDESYRGSGKRTADADYWQTTLTDLPEQVGMIAGRAFSAHHFHRAALNFTSKQGKSLILLADRHAMPWPDVITALVASYCQRFTATPEIIVGVPHMGRFGSATARVPAMVMNVLPVRVAPDETAPLAEVFATVGKSLIRARRHGRYRSEQMRRDLGLIGGNRRLYGPLINVLPFDQPLEISGLALKTTVLSTGPVDDITFSFRGDAHASLTLEVDTNPELYSARETQEHAQRIIAFLEQASIAQTLSDISTTTDAETSHLIFGVNATDHYFPDTNLAALINAQIEATPNAIAVTFGAQTLTYRELSRRCDALQDQLRLRGIGSDTIVAIALARSLELVIALVAIVRAGGAYLPLDLAHPLDRLQRIINSAQPLLILADAKNVARLPEIEILSREAWLPAAAPQVALPIKPSDAAYVIYTSGSTGEPKGVVIEHRAIVNRLLWMAEHYNITAADRVLQKTPTTFDVSVWEFFLPLIVGASVVVAPPEAHRDPVQLIKLIRDSDVTTAHFVPSMMAAFLAEPEVNGLKMSRIFCSGEELSADLSARFHRTIDAELHNLYGPTEAAVDVSYWQCTPNDPSPRVPIGLPVWNTRLYILDDHLRPVPKGVTGHLYLGGVQLARGYLNRPDLTAERFLPDPFRDGERIYRTGDLATRRVDDAVIYLGRSDHQVKIRGLRIELGDIEAAIVASGMCVQNVVIDREDRTGTHRLVAYLVANNKYSSELLRDYLAAHLPDYMVPLAFVALDALPVTVNGKLDRAALPAPEFIIVPSRAPSTPTERTLAKLFALTLGLINDLGSDADFFSLGGDSLSAVNLMLEIRESFGRDPGLGSLFEHPTIAALALTIDQNAEVDDGLKPLITLASGAVSAPPLFVVHPAGGIAWCYRDLARALAPTRTVYGLQAPALNPDVEIASSIDALAIDYVDRILDLNTSGPIHLAGWSVGGLIAHAMAVRFNSLGRDVGLVAMFDSYPAECWRAEPEPRESDALRSLIAIAGHDPEDHLDLVSRHQIVGFLRAGDSPLGRLPEATLDGVIRVVTQTNRLVREHFHGHFHGTLTHIRAGLDHAGTDLASQLWAPYSRKLDLIEVPFLHPQLTGAAATAQIAPLLAERLETIDKDRN